MRAAGLAGRLAETAGRPVDRAGDIEAAVDEAAGEDPPVRAGRALYRIHLWSGIFIASGGVWTGREGGGSLGGVICDPQKPMGAARWF